jgi:hypothetical protein
MIHPIIKISDNRLSYIIKNLSIKNAITFFILKKF